jgi:hypothetical protein
MFARKAIEAARQARGAGGSVGEVTLQPMPARRMGAAPAAVLARLAAAIASAASLLLIAALTICHAQVINGTPLSASSGNRLMLQRPPPCRRLWSRAFSAAYICGFAAVSTGVTSAVVVSLTVTGLAGGTMTFPYAAAAGVTTANPSLVMTFQPCLPEATPGANIGVSLPPHVICREEVPAGPMAQSSRLRENPWHRASPPGRTATPRNFLGRQPARSRRTGSCGQR